MSARHPRGYPQLINDLAKSDIPKAFGAAQPSDGGLLVGESGGAAGGGLALPLTFPEIAHGDVDEDLEIDLSRSDAHAHVLKATGDFAISFINIPSRSMHFTLDILQDEDGGHTISSSSDTTFRISEEANARTLITGLVVNGRLYLVNYEAALNLGSLNDVTLDTPTDKQVLGYDSGSKMWQNRTLETAEGYLATTSPWSVIVTIAEGIWTTIKSIVQATWDLIKLVPDAVWTGIAAIGATIWGAIKDIGTTIWGLIKGFADWVWKAASDFVSLWYVRNSSGQVLYFTPAEAGRTGGPRVVNGRTVEDSTYTTTVSGFDVFLNNIINVAVRWLQQDQGILGWLYKQWVSVTSGIGKIVTDFLTWVGNAWEATVESILKWFYTQDSSGNIQYYTATEAAKDNPTGGVDTPTSDKFTPHFNWTNFFTNFWREVTNLATNIADAVLEWWNSSTNVLVVALRGVGNAIFDFIKAVGPTIWKVISEIGNGVWYIVSAAADFIGGLFYDKNSNGDILYYTEAEITRTSGTRTSQGVYPPAGNKTIPKFRWSNFFGGVTDLAGEIGAAVNSLISDAFDGLLIGIGGAVDVAWTTLTDHIDGLVAWFNGDNVGGGGASTLAELTDTTLSSSIGSTTGAAADGRVLTYHFNSKKWIDQAPAFPAILRNTIVFAHEVVGGVPVTSTVGADNSNSIGFDTIDNMFIKTSQNTSNVFMQFGTRNTLEFGSTYIKFGDNMRNVLPISDGEIRAARDEDTASPTLFVKVKGVVKDLANIPDGPVPIVTDVAIVPIYGSSDPVNVNVNTLDDRFGDQRGCIGIVYDTDELIEGFASNQLFLYVRADNYWIRRGAVSRLGSGENTVGTAFTGGSKSRIPYSQSNSNDPTVGVDVEDTDGVFYIHQEDGEDNDGSWGVVYDGDVEDFNWRGDGRFVSSAGDAATIPIIQKLSVYIGSALSTSTNDSVFGSAEGSLGWYNSLRRVAAKVNGRWWSFQF